MIYFGTAMRIVVRLQALTDLVVEAQFAFASPASALPTDSLASLEH